MPDTLLMLHIHVEVTHQDNAAIGSDAFFASAKLPRLHVALHDVHAIFLVKRNPGNFIKAHHIVLTHQTSLARCVIDKHPGHSGFATGN